MFETKEELFAKIQQQDEVIASLSEQVKALSTTPVDPEPTEPEEPEKDKTEPEETPDEIDKFLGL